MLKSRAFSLSRKGGMLNAVIPLRRFERCRSPECRRERYVALRCLLVMPVYVIAARSSEFVGFVIICRMTR